MLKSVGVTFQIQAAIRENGLMWPTVLVHGGQNI